MKKSCKFQVLNLQPVIDVFYCFGLIEYWMLVLII